MTVMLAVLKKFAANAHKASCLYNQYKRCWRIRSVFWGRRKTQDLNGRYYSSPPGNIKSLRSVISPPISKIRNIGIMAHIDAGKTTTTERMLYYSGYTRVLGDVDDGDTVTDFMAQERERGITIQSAAVTFDWNDHRINLIDTPGHVDFTVEVERSLRVLDGAVAVFDASAGVEAQTLTVWRQADKHQIPRICFLNKMDKTGASFSYSIESIRQKLKITPLILQLPIGEENSFKGLVDLVTNEKLIWRSTSYLDDGKLFEQIPLTEMDNLELFEDAKDARNLLIEQVAELDDEFAELVLGDFSENFDSLPAEKLQAAIRRLTLTRSAVPVLCGSALKNKGVQPLLDAITMYLPSPNECCHDFLQWYRDDLCALAFKVIHDKQRGPLVFLRIYSGTLKPQSAVHNINKNCTERMSRLLLPFADQNIEIPLLTEGNIALSVGLKQTATGDTIVSSKASAVAAARRAERDDRRKHSDGKGSESLILAGIDVPEPVFFCTIEPPSLARQQDLEYALNCLQREDPSLKVKTDPDSGQTILCGMGELHIEIVHDRIRREHKLETYLGPLQIAYRETIVSSARATDTLDRTIGETRHMVTVELAVRPLLVEASLTMPVIEYAESITEQLPKDLQEAVDNGIHASYLQGPLIGFPLQNVGITVHLVNMQPGTSMTMVSACISRCIHKGYSTVLRTLTSGSATFTLELSSYEAMNPQHQATLVNRMGGLV
ncbi:ribosome-releasing factor 2, mitochondrial isoform X2 [Rhinatrema bivittatum]|uniref:ribosome-releasing factor 2, mitochondrial isoform X2 n=1 Tax=Rhinatrema bivittatum TaxID=194408 RepID=UPI00112DAB36|nr:ribosome-releasing factor 2, mitochondrial isoform X2 [Rhinatrema bivittatum]